MAPRGVVSTPLIARAEAQLGRPLASAATELDRFAGDLGRLPSVHDGVDVRPLRVQLQDEPAAELAFATRLGARRIGERYDDPLATHADRVQKTAALRHEQGLRNCSYKVLSKINQKKVARPVMHVGWARGLELRAKRFPRLLWPFPSVANHRERTAILSNIVTDQRHPSEPVRQLAPTKGTGRA